jgi:predicted RNase H-like nuclease (RuvC/YqgF family)
MFDFRPESPPLQKPFSGEIVMNAAVSRTDPDTQPSLRRADPDAGHIVELGSAIRAALAANRGPRRDAPAEQDWGQTLDLVQRASDVLKSAEQRVRELEESNRSLAERAAREAEVLEARVLQAQIRAEDAEQRRRDAEEWLRRIHNAILEHLSA